MIPMTIATTFAFAAPAMSEQTLMPYVIEFPTQALAAPATAPVGTVATTSAAATSGVAATVGGFATVPALAGLAGLAGLAVLGGLDSVESSTSTF